MRLLEELMRTALGVIISLAWLPLPASAAGWENVLSNDWSVSFPGHSDSAPAVGGDGTIYFGTWRGKLWALNPDGSQQVGVPGGK